jgi:tRNA-dihydrouridine synthase
MAPMLGLTDSAFRAAHMGQFGGFDCGITPFIKTIQGGRFKHSKMADFLPSRNTRLPIIPQILSNNSDDFIALARHLFDLGYEKINVNFGCPVPMTAGRGRGAGLLPHPEFVDRFLEEILSAIPNALSIKTRIGFDRVDQLLAMTKVFNRYPLFEIAVHPRTAAQGYSGSVNHAAFKEVLDALMAPVIYSGDIDSLETFIAMKRLYPGISRWMIGRGALSDPYLPMRIRNYLQDDRLDDHLGKVPVPKLIDFYDEFTRQLQTRRTAENHILVRLKTHFYYHADFLGVEKSVVKGIRKSRSLPQFFCLAANMLNRHITVDNN